MAVLFLRVVACSSVFAAMSVSVIGSACVPDVASPAVAAHTAVAPLTGPCPISGGGVEFESEISSLRVTVSASDMPEAFVAEGPVGSVTVDAVPAGDDRNVGVFGFVEQTPLWRGAALHLSLADQEKKQIDVLLARVADVTCARNADTAPRMFPTVTPLPDGTLLVIGGAQESAEAGASCGGCRRLSATPSASLFDPRAGTFTSVGILSQARMLHTATALPDGRVVVAGGTGTVLVHPSGDSGAPLPFEPTTPLDSVEVYDPDTKSFTAVGRDPGGPRVFHAATLTLNDEVLITGGVPGRATKNDLSNALRTTTLCSGTPLSCRTGPQMVSRRAGHVAFRIDERGAFVWGGSIDIGPQNGLAGFQLEALARSGAFSLLNVKGMNASRNVFFAATAQYKPYRVMSAGGLVRDADGTFQVASIDVDGLTGVSPVWVFDSTAVDGGAEGGIATSPTNGTPMHLRSARFWAASAPLPSGTHSVIAGGYEDLELTLSDELALFDERTLSVDAVTVGGQARRLRQPRAGGVMAAIGDGNAFFIGGEGQKNNGVGPLSTAEIFADPQTPAEVAE